MEQGAEEDVEEFKEEAIERAKEGVWEEGVDVEIDEEVE